MNKMPEEREDKAQLAPLGTMVDADNTRPNSVEAQRKHDEVFGEITDAGPNYRNVHISLVCVLTHRLILKRLDGLEQRP